MWGQLKKRDIYTIEDIKEVIDTKTSIKSTKFTHKSFMKWKEFLDLHYSKVIPTDESLQIKLGGDEVNAAAFSVVKLRKNRLLQTVYLNSWPELGGIPIEVQLKKGAPTEEGINVKNWKAERLQGPKSEVLSSAPAYPAKREEDLLKLLSQGIPEYAKSDPMWKAVIELQNKKEEDRILKKEMKKMKKEAEAREKEAAKIEKERVRAGAMERSKLAREEKRKRKQKDKEERDNIKKRKKETDMIAKTCKGTCKKRWNGSQKWLWCEHCDEHGMCPKCLENESDKLINHEVNCVEMQTL